MNKLVIFCADGVSASIRHRHHIRTYMSDVVIKSMYDILPSNKCARQIVMDSIRGGALFGKQRKIRRFIDRYNQAGNVLLCVGKSYGGYNLINVLHNFMQWSNYNKVVLVTVDACSIDKIIGKKEFIQPPKVDELWNYHQHNNRYMNGYRIHGATSWIHQVDLSGVPDMNHWNIVENHSIKCELKSVIEGLISD